MIPVVTDSNWGKVRHEEARRTLLHLQTDWRRYSVKTEEVKVFNSSKTEERTK